MAETNNKPSEGKERLTGVMNTKRTSGDGESNPRNVELFVSFGESYETRQKEKKGEKCLDFVFE